MTDPNFETLLRSPLDDEPEPSGWGSAVLGFVGGGVVVIALSLILGLWATPDKTPSTNPTADATTTETAAMVETANSYPDGFSDIGGSVAMKPVAVVTGDDGFVVSFATATDRASDPAATPGPLGGRWQIESVGGSVTGVTQLVYDRTHTGVIGTAFPGYPSEGDVIRMTERWDPDERTSSIEIPFTGTPISTIDAAELDLGDGITLRLDQLELGRHLDQVVWGLLCEDNPKGVAAFEVEIVDDEGAAIGTYLSMPSPREPMPAGVIDLFWDQGFNVHPDRGSAVRITATAQLVSPESADVVYELESIPSGD